MKFQGKRMLMAAVVLASLLLVGASQAVTTQATLRSDAALYLVSQYKALIGDGDGAVDALLAATEQNATCTAPSHSQSDPHITQAKAECRFARTSKRT